MDSTTTKQSGKRPMIMSGFDTMIEGMPDTPQRRGPHHRRAHSDTSFRFDISSVSADDDDLLLFDTSDLDLSSLVADLPPTPPPAPSAPMAVDSDESSSTAARPKPPVSHFRSLSVDSDFFDGLNLGSGRSSAAEEATAAGGNKRVGLHRHSSSMDGSSTASFELDSSALVDGVKKAMGPDKLAELALIDPKRAKRILANRQSAARSKERKIRYTSELERKVQTLQTEATTLSAQVTMLQRDTTGLSAENKEMKLRLQAMEQQAQLRDALNEALRDEVQRLKIATGQIPAANGNPFNQGLRHQYSSHQPTMHPFGSHQNQQQQLHMPQSSTNNQVHNGHPQPRFANFSQMI